MRIRMVIAGVAAGAAWGFGCGEQEAEIAPPRLSQAEWGHADPSVFTQRVNAAMLAELPFEDQTDFADARRGWIASRENPVIEGPEGREVWNTDRFAFEQGDSPDSVNPSLWRQAKLNAIHGLFEVREGIYQMRGYDLANMTLVVGEQGWIVIDPLTTRETASASLALAREHLGARPITALIYTHSHIDHFGGSRGVLPGGNESDSVPVIAPEGFVGEAMSENVLAGNAMSRRAAYMFGFLLHAGPRGHVDSGLGKASTPGTFGLVAPNDFIGRTGETRTIDGVKFVFELTPGAEAPVEMMIYLPERRALCGAEDVSHVMHNLYTLRGAKVRDALRWSGYLDEAMGRFAEAEVLFSSHHWPVWGRERVRELLSAQRDLYKFIHDQTLRLANHGMTPREIAEQLELPSALARRFANRGYYGTLSHNVKAVYQRYFGWFDGNPAHLSPLPPEQSAPRYVEFMGGPEALLEKARASYARGEYRWVAMVLDHLVFADPGNREARELLADSYDQLGYQAESGPWRDFYLTGAEELRRGPQKLPFRATASSDVVSAMPTDLFFDALAVRLNGPEAAEDALLINFVFTDIGETHVIEVSNGVLHHHRTAPRGDADATVKLSRALWNEVVTGRASLPGQILKGHVDVDGSRTALLRFFSRLDDFEPAFPIVTP